MGRSLWALFLVACGGQAVEPPRPAVVATRPVAAAPSTSQPATRREDFHETMHGVDIVDPYRWLEDDASPETHAWEIDDESAELAFLVWQLVMN